MTALELGGTTTMGPPLLWATICLLLLPLLCRFPRALAEEEEAEEEALRLLLASCWVSMLLILSKEAGDSSMELRSYRTSSPAWRMSGPPVRARLPAGTADGFETAGAVATAPSFKELEDDAGIAMFCAEPMAVEEGLFSLAVLLEAASRAAEGLLEAGCSFDDVVFCACCC